jgi:hypothetical protein
MESLPSNDLIESVYHDWILHAMGSRKALPKRESLWSLSKNGNPRLPLMREVSPKVTEGEKTFRK